MSEDGGFSNIGKQLFVFTPRKGSETGKCQKTLVNQLSTENMVCGPSEGPLADNFLYQFGQWLICEFPHWLNELLSIIVLQL